MILSKSQGKELDWKKSLHQWSLPSTIRGRYEIRSITSVLPTVIFVLMSVAALKVYSERYIVAILLVLFSAFLWQQGRQIIRTRRLRPFVLITLLIGVGIITAESFLFDSLRPNIASPIMPLVAFFYLGRRVGSWVSAILFVHILLLMFVINPTADVQNAMTVVVCYLMIATISRLYESTRLQTEKTLDRQSNTDELTGASNRRVLDKILSREMNRARRETLPLSVFMMDVDKFKSINDTQGHYVGDQVLKSICRVIQHNMRSTDYLIRYGGDEFVIVTPTTDFKQAIMVVDKIKNEMSEHEFDVEGTVSASFGIAELESDDTVDSFINRADMALYHLRENQRSLPA